MTSPAEQIVGLYERHARAWVADRQRGAFLERRWLEHFVGLLPRGATVLDIGCGAGEAIGSYAGEPLYHASLSGQEYRSLLHDHGFAVREHVVEDPACGRHTVWLAQRET